MGAKGSQRDSAGPGAGFGTRGGYWGAPSPEDELTLPLDWELRPGVTVRLFIRRSVVTVELPADPQ